VIGDTFARCERWAGVCKAGRLDLDRADVLCVSVNSGSPLPAQCDSVGFRNDGFAYIAHQLPIDGEGQPSMGEVRHMAVCAA
jgi:hypothetical protein